MKIDKWSIWRFCHPSFHSPSNGVSLTTTWPAAFVCCRKVPCGPHFCHCSHHLDGIPSGCPLSLSSPLQAGLSSWRAAARSPPWTVTGFPYTLRSNLTPDTFHPLALVLASGPRHSIIWTTQIIKVTACPPWQILPRFPQLPHVLNSSQASPV